MRIFADLSYEQCSTCLHLDNGCICETALAKGSPRQRGSPKRKRASRAPRPTKKHEDSNHENYHKPSQSRKEENHKGTQKPSQYNADGRQEHRKGYSSAVRESIDCPINSVGLTCMYIQCDMCRGQRRKCVGGEMGVSACQSCIATGEDCSF